MRYNMLTVMGLLSGVSFYTLADSTISIHISEDNTVITESDSKNAPTYITKGSLQKFDLKDQNDVNELAKSVEFEVFVINENSQIHTVFEHGGGVCYGYLNNGVEVTDSATYYLKDKSKNEYYANISGGIVNHDGMPKKVQYASVFNINDPNMSKYLKEQDKQRGQNIAKKNLQDRVSVLSNVVCPTKNNKKGK
ncbi:hypothetical protein [Lonepinella sp. BR2357]|uniref:hypothetical protein n=1 Tax=Lonepinella sp. BR2357 TaxID=3434549 RepID=UPI003F6DCCAC